MTITNSDPAIESADVLKRIAELEDAQTEEWRITQTRSGIRLGSSLLFRTYADASQYLDERDYNLYRFSIEKGTIFRSDANETELAYLRQLNQDGRNTFGSSRWITEGVTLRPASYFTSDWALDQATERLSISFSQLDEWPMNLIGDWYDAAIALRNEDYRRVWFGDRDYYGSN